MSSILFRLSVLTVAVAGSGYCNDVISTKITFAQEVSRIFNKRCGSCPRQGGKAPMSLGTYEEARPWAKAIKEEVLERRMPPWGAVKGFGSFRNEQALSQEEISTLSDWVEGGAPEGDPKYLPGKPHLDPPGARPQGVILAVTDNATIARAGRLVGIQPKVKADVKSLRIVAEQPDGSIEPLLWLRNYKSAWDRVFEFRQPIAVAAGTRIRVEPPGQGSFLVYVR